MGIRYLKKHAVLEGHVSVEEAEGFMQWLCGQTSPAVDLQACEHVHASVLQLLLIWRPRIRKPPADTWLAAALRTA
ncbi:MAG: hypothetical protein QM742_02590 [Aquabacterium sp.]